MCEVSNRTLGLDEVPLREMTRLSARRLAKPIIGVLALVIAALPDLAEAGAWVLPKGRANIQIALLHQDTTERYFLDGERIPYFFEGRTRTSAV